MYKNNNGLIEWTIDIKSFMVEFFRKCKSFEVDPTSVKFYSQQDEDKYIIQYLLKDKINDGTFLEVGGMDGITYSNTKTLEDFFGFSGIIIEPVPEQYNKLVVNRPNCKTYNCCISNIQKDDVLFIGNNGCSGIVETINNTSFNMITDKKKYYVQNRKLEDIIRDSKLDYIDIMSIDVEGSELSLLKSIDFSFPIFCIIIEAHSTEQEKNKIFGDFLKKNGFTYKERQRGNEIWINHNYFRKHLFNY